MQNERQMSLLAGLEEKRRGMERVLSKTPNAYKQAMEDALRSFEIGRTFTVEDLTAIAGRPPAGTHFNAVGAVINSLAAKKLMRKTGQVTRAKRPGMHATELPIWERV